MEWRVRFQSSIAEDDFLLIEANTIEDALEKVKMLTTKVVMSIVSTAQWRRV